MSTAPTQAAPVASTLVSGPDALVAIGQHRLVGNYRQPGMVLDRGKGCEVWDTSGKRYLDLCAGVAVSILGHAHPKLTKAIADQAGRLMHMSNYFYNAENLRLADELCTVTGYDRVMFCNSGAEAIEGSFKLARRYHWSKGDASRVRMIAFHNAFHGRTMGALALTGTPKYREGFGKPVEGVTHVAYGDLDAVRAQMSAEVAAIIVEPVQGEGGVLPAPEGFLKGLRALADEHGALLILDEVQTGIARTGAWLGSDLDSVKGDIVALAKGLGGGFPIGAMLAREDVAAALTPGSHGSTYGGNALASAAARAVLHAVKEEGLIQASRDLGEHLGKGLAAIAKKHPSVAVGERGRGLLRGLILADAADPRATLGKLREAGVLLTIAGERVLRFTPPLVITRGEIDEALGIVDDVLGSL
jgi:acetylornithine/N-succinyldiaminopimelate aminotransferase